MGKFLKENWLYIVLPIVLVLGAVLALALTSKNNDSGANQGYEI